MQYITATDAKQTFAALIDKAQLEPVTIRKQNRDVAVVLSAIQYENLRRLNIQEFQTYCESLSQKATARGLTEDLLNYMLTAE